MNEDPFSELVARLPFLAELVAELNSWWNNDGEDDDAPGLLTLLTFVIEPALRQRLDEGVRMDEAAAILDYVDELCWSRRDYVADSDALYEDLAVPLTDDLSDLGFSRLLAMAGPRFREIVPVKRRSEPWARPPRPKEG